MTEQEVLGEFRAAGALLEGHFILSSGLRSPRYLQCARLLMDPQRAERIARALVVRIAEEIRAQVDVVISPAMGGVIIGHELGVPYTALVRIDVPAYPADQLPPELEAIPPVKPGSRAAA